MKSILKASKFQLFANRFSTSTIDKPAKYDITFVGGGIVGLATARELQMRYPNMKMCLLEKEKLLSMHQSGHNSGVIHAGIYYPPGSLKAKLCVEGLKRTYEYCDKNNIKYKKCGKMIVATDDVEVGRLADLMKRGIANEVPDLKLLDPAGIKEIEPNCRGLQAIHSPHTGIVDWREVALHFGKDFEKMKGDIYLNFEVNDFKESIENPEYPVLVMNKKNNQAIQTKYVIVCGGLQADRLAVMSGCDPNPKIVAFRGDYLVLKPHKQDMVRGNIYPVPDPRFPFLGVHFTPRIDGGVWLGPNAILSFKREGYHILSFDFWDTWENVKYSGLRKIAMKHLKMGITEMINVAFLSKQVKLLQKFVPSIKVEDVERGPCGIRAQALDPQGNLVDDFVFHRGQTGLGSRVMHVRNAPSPAATSSLSIGRMIADKAETDFAFK